MIIVCKFHDPSIIGSRDTEGGGGGSEEPPPVTDWPKKPSLNRVKERVLLIIKIFCCSCKEKNHFTRICYHKADYFPLISFLKVRVSMCATWKLECPKRRSRARAQFLVSWEKGCHASCFDRLLPRLHCARALLKLTKSTNWLFVTVHQYSPYSRLLALFILFTPRYLRPFDNCYSRFPDTLLKGRKSSGKKRFPCDEGKLVRKTYQS